MAIQLLGTEHGDRGPETLVHQYWFDETKVESSVVSNEDSVEEHVYDAIGDVSQRRCVPNISIANAMDVTVPDSEVWADKRVENHSWLGPGVEMNNGNLDDRPGIASESDRFDVDDR